MTAAPPSLSPATPSPATLIDQDEMAARIHTWLLALAAYALAMAERLGNECGVTASFPPLAWLFASAARRRCLRVNTAARTLQALAAMFEPQAFHAEPGQNPLPDDEAPAAAPAPFTWPRVPVCPPTEHPTPMLRLCKAGPAAFAPHANRPHALPPRPRLRPALLHRSRMAQEPYGLVRAEPDRVAVFRRERPALGGDPGRGGWRRIPCGLGHSGP